MARGAEFETKDAVGIRGRPTLRAIKTFLGQVNKPYVFWSAVLAEAQKDTSIEGREHFAWLASLTNQLRVRLTKKREFKGECIRFVGGKTQKRKFDAFGYGYFAAHLLTPEGKAIKVGRYRLQEKKKRSSERPFGLYRSRVNTLRAPRTAYARVQSASDFAFVLTHGFKLSAGYHVGHLHQLSHSNACVNPAHLRIELRSENCSEGARWGAMKRRLGLGKRPPGCLHGRKPNSKKAPANEVGVDEKAGTVGGIPY